MIWSLVIGLPRLVVTGRLSGRIRPGVMWCLIVNVARRLWGRCELSDVGVPNSESGHPDIWRCGPSLAHRRRDVAAALCVRSSARAMTTSATEFGAQSGNNFRLLVDSNR